MSSNLIGFFAYAGNPPEIGQTIEQAISRVNQSTDTKVNSWKALDIPGHFISQEVLSNIDNSDYLVADISVLNFNVTYEIKTKSIFKSIVLSGLVNNVFGEKYESNGYYYTYDDDWSVPGSITTIEGTGYYPQATTNFLVGATLKF